MSANCKQQLISFQQVYKTPYGLKANVTILNNSFKPSYRDCRKEPSL